MTHRRTIKDEYWSKLVKCSYKPKDTLGRDKGDKVFETSCVAQLKVPKNTKVYTEGNHHRAEKANVEDIYFADTANKGKGGKGGILEAWSGYNNSTKYVVGEMLVADNFSDNREMNAGGIHGWTSYRHKN